MRILSRYQGVDWKTWAFLWARWTLTPYLKIVGELPKSGRILDLGCGHGLLALAIAQRGESYKVLAYDHDGERVKIAQQAASGLSNLTVQQGGMIFPEGVFSGITMIDVMHYFPESEQHTMAEEAFKHLEPGGRLLVRDVNPDAGVVASLNRLYEKLATQTGFTRSN